MGEFLGLARDASNVVDIASLGAGLQAPNGHSGFISSARGIQLSHDELWALALLTTTIAAGSWAFLL
jgi:hypothetical protein